MTFINTNGMAFIGPGSEWFWTAVSGLVLVVTFVAIYRQLQLQANSSANDQIDTFVREARDERAIRALLDVTVSLRDGAPMPEAAALEIANFWDKFATMARSGRRDAKLLWQWEPRNPQIAWLILGSWVREGRRRTGDPSSYANLEWLAGTMAEMDRRAGLAPVTEELVSTSLTRWIAVFEDQIRVAEALRTIVVVSLAGTAPRRRTRSTGGSGKDAAPHGGVVRTLADPVL